MRTFISVNAPNRYLLWFSQCSPRYLLVYTDSLDDALDDAADWLSEHAPGLLADEEVTEEYRRLVESGLSEDEALEESEVDTTLTDGGHYFHSDEWGIVLENPTDDEIQAWQDGQ